MAGNANSGRRPQPTRLKILRGNPGRRHLNVNEPQPPPASPDFDQPPPELANDSRAAAEWTRVVPMLRLCGVISNAERSALVALCQQWSRYLSAQDRVIELGMVVKRANGNPMVNPYLAVADSCLTQCHRLWIELGLTPSSRSKLSALTPDDAAVKSKWDGLL